MYADLLDGGYGRGATTGPDGSYTITGLVTGQYRVRAYAEGYFGEYYDGVYQYHEATPVSVTMPDDTPDIEFTLDSVISNEHPVADAGPDQQVYAIPPAITAMVALDGSGSYDPDGDPLTYTWTWDGNTAHGLNPAVELPLGTTTITLVVNDGKVDSEPDTVSITVCIQASLDFDPDVLNLRVRRGVVTVYIELPEGCDPKHIDVPSIRLNGMVSALESPVEVGDYNHNGVPDLMVKFDRAAVQALVETGDSVKMTVTGEVNGIPFGGTDMIKVIGP